MSSQLWAADWNKVQCPSDLVLAQEFITAELSGWRIPGEPSSCLDQTQFRFFPVNNSGLNEPSKSQPIIIDRSRKVSVKVIPKSSYKRRADFYFDGKYAGHFYFELFPQAGNQPSPLRRDFGCAGVYAYPAQRYVWRQCLNQKAK